MKFLQILLVALLFCVPALRPQEVPTATGPLIAQSSESRLVWVNTATGIYHYSGTRWYGKTKQGKFMSEAEARAKGYDRLEMGSDGGKQITRGGFAWLRGREFQVNQEAEIKVLRIASGSVTQSQNRPQRERLSRFKVRIFVIYKLKSTLVTETDGRFGFSEGEGVE